MAAMVVAYILTGLIAGGTLAAILAAFIQRNVDLAKLVAGEMSPGEYESGRARQQSHSEMDIVYRRVGESYLDSGKEILGIEE